MNALWNRNGIKTGVLAAALAAAVYAHDGNHGLVFGARTNAAQEVPKVTLEGDPQGLIGFKLNETQDTMLVYGAFQGLSSAVTKFHIHAGEKGQAGPVALDVFPLVKDRTIAANWTGFGPKDVRQFLRGAYYINVHTSAYPNGEMRGQIDPEMDRLWTAELKGGNAIPAVATPATGVAIFQLSPDDSILTVKAYLQGIPDSVTGAHIHEGGAASTGNVVANLVSRLSGNTIAARIRVSSLARPAAFLDSLKKGSLYVNVHTEANTSGEIRGQLKPRQGIAFQANLNGANEAPAVVTPATGLGLFTLSDNDSLLTVNVVFGGLKDSVTAAHLHRGAPGTSGPVVVNLTSGISGNSVTANIVLGNLADQDAFLADLVKGNIYVNVHTKANTAGEIRGQVVLPARIGFAFNLTGAQEVPVVPGSGFAAAIATLDADGTNIKFETLADGLSSPLKMAHFHQGAFGVNGGLALNVTGSFSDNASSGVWTDRDAIPLTPVLAEAFHSSGLYLNIHTQSHPDGELRGQAADLKASRSVSTVAISLPPAGGQARGRDGIRLHMAANGRGLRLEGRPSATVALSLIDVTGKLRRGFRVGIGADAFSPELDLTSLRPGLYFATWEEGGSLRKASFLRP
ncbi:MAG: hypothetical protein JWO30_4946 [Fibrobacteres bacterium]|nr:hypothetical protein [Fibrobacterota bacterium]